MPLEINFPGRKEKTSAQIMGIKSNGNPLDTTI